MKNLILAAAFASLALVSCESTPMNTVEAGSAPMDMEATECEMMETTECEMMEATECEMMEATECDMSAKEECDMSAKEECDSMEEAN